MIMGIGVDTVNIERFERIVTETPAFVRRVFTPNERTRNVRSQAVRFAAKEAVAKVLGAPAGLNWQDCEVATAESGQPYLIIQGTIARRAKELGINRASYLTVNRPKETNLARLKTRETANRTRPPPYRRR